ncbi:hypothetical protein BH10ACT11_BH10ACT11_10510 [soil metagenome]
MIDDGIAVHYNDLKMGTPVYGSDEVVAGKVVRVMDLAREAMLDGIVVEGSDGRIHFVDAPEVKRTAEKAVTLTIPAAEVEALDPPRGSALDSVKDNVRGKLFGR